MSVTSESQKARSASTRGRTATKSSSSRSSAARKSGSGSARSQSGGGRAQSSNGRSQSSGGGAASSGGRSQSSNGRSQSKSSSSRSKASRPAAAAKSTRDSATASSNGNGEHGTLAGVGLSVLGATVGVAGGVLLGRRTARAGRKVLGIAVPERIDLGGMAEQIGEAGRQFGRLAGEVQAMRRKAEQIGRILT
jgi:hypothetical protein